MIEMNAVSSSRKEGSNRGGKKGRKCTLKKAGKREKSSMIKDDLNECC